MMEKLKSLKDKKYTLDPVIQYKIKNVTIGSYKYISCLGCCQLKVNQSYSAWCFSFLFLAMMISYVLYGILSLGTVSNVSIIYQAFKPFTVRDPDLCQKVKDFPGVDEIRYDEKGIWYEVDKDGILNEDCTTRQFTQGQNPPNEKFINNHPYIDLDIELLWEQNCESWEVFLVNE